jgi:hypothetical protein
MVRPSSIVEPGSGVIQNFRRSQPPTVGATILRSTFFPRSDSYCTRVVSKVTQSVSEGGNARPRLRFGLLDWNRKHLSSACVE